MKEEKSYQLLIKIIGAKKLSEMNELKMGPINVFFPRSATPTTVL